MRNDHQTFEKLVNLINTELPALGLDKSEQLASKIQYSFANSYPANLEQVHFQLKQRVKALEALLNEYNWLTNPDRMGK